MHTITMRSHVGRDGVLKLEIPVGLADANLEVVVVVQPLLSPNNADGGAGWPAGFFEETYGSFADEPLERGDQGLVEVRDKLRPR